MRRAAFITGWEADKWIAVEEQTPPELVDLLIYIPDEDHIAAAIYEKKEGFYENYDFITIENRVSHWMLMPPPLKK